MIRDTEAGGKRQGVCVCGGGSIRKPYVDVNIVDRVAAVGLYERLGFPLLAQNVLQESRRCARRHAVEARKATHDGLGPAAEVARPGLALGHVALIRRQVGVVQVVLAHIDLGQAHLVRAVVADQVPRRQRRREPSIRGRRFGLGHETLHRSGRHGAHAGDQVPGEEGEEEGE